VGTVIRTNYALWKPPDDWLQELAASTPEKVRINGGGEVSKHTPGEVARGIRDGQVWAYYGGYPFYWLDAPWGLPPANIGQEGFSAFLRQAGMYFPHDFWADKNLFQYPRGLRVLSEDLPKFIIPNPYAPRTSHIFGSFGLKIESGYFFWAYGDGDGQGVTPDRYARFITEVVEPPVPQPVPPDGAPPPAPDGRQVPRGVPPIVYALGGLGAVLGIYALARRR